MCPIFLQKKRDQNIASQILKAKENEKKSKYVVSRKIVAYKGKFLAQMKHNSKKQN